AQRRGDGVQAKDSFHDCSSATAPGFLCRLPRTVLRTRFARLFHGLEVDLSFLEIDSRDAHADGIGKTITSTGTLTYQPLVHRVMLVVIVLQRGDMNQAFDLHLVEFDKQTEAGHAGNDAVELLADLV